MSGKSISAKKATVKSGRTAIEAEAREIGEDIIVMISGGTQPHIGSVAIAIPRPSRQDPSLISATCSCFNFIGHQDDFIDRMVPERIAIAKQKNTVVTAGIHVDNISETEIRNIVRDAEALCSALIKKL